MLTLKSSRVGRLLWIVVTAALGIAAMTYGALRGIEVTRFLAAAVPVAGHVLGYERDCPADAEPRWLFYPILTFSDRSGDPVQVVSRHGVAGKRFATGSQVEVRYLAPHPQTVSIRTPQQWWKPSLVWCLIGLLLLIPALRAGQRGLRSPLPQPAD